MRWSEFPVDSLPAETPTVFVRRIFLHTFSLLLIVLAMLGGSKGIVLCLHEAGVLHLETSTLAADNGTSCAKTNPDLCGTKDTHDCGWCLDVPVQGIEVAQLRLDSDDLQIVPPVFTFSILLQSWGMPAAATYPTATAESPLVLSSALLVVQTAVLLI